MSEPVRCGVCFENVEEFRAAFTARGKGVCFVAYPDEVEPGRLLVIDVDLAQRVRLELDGLAQQADFDDRGNTGVLVALSAASSAVLEKLEVDLSQGTVPEVFATTRSPRPELAKVTNAVQPAGVEESPDKLLEPGTMVDERFCIESHLATGGMGEVYRANHVHLKRPVALKLLRRVFAGDSDMWARFQREAELVSQLESPHVVRVFDFGRTHEGQPYLAMEYVEGTTLDVLLEAGPLAPARAADLLVQVCAGLTEAHAVGVIHRDLKPANLIIGRRRDSSEVLKILDFGIARLGDQAGRSEKQKLTQLGIVVGTPAYLAPEQALADDLDQRTDIYSLGCVAYELLTGGPPFRSLDLAKVLSLHLTAAPPPLESLRPELAAWPQLCAAVLKALSKERDRRFSSATEFAQALTASTAAGASAASGWPPDDARVPTITTAPASLPHPIAEVDDFFEASTPAPNRPRPRAVAPPQPTHSLTGRLAAARDALRPTVSRAAFLFVEVLGVPAESEAARAALERALEVASTFGAFGEASDEDGVVLGFAATTQPPVLRAAYAALAMRDAVAFESAQTPGATARLRCGLVVDELVRPRPAVSGALAKSRTLCARAQAGQVACDRLLVPELAAGLELSNVGEVLVATARKAPRRGPTQLVGREATLELLERRLVGLQQGVVAPLVIRGPEGSGRTAVALELAMRARQRSLVVIHVTATPSWARTPGSLVAALVCAAVGVPMGARSRLLSSALEALKLPAPVIEAVLVVSGVVQPTWAFTAGQGAQALRSVLRAGALDRPVVLVIDGLEHVDKQGLEVFGELVTRPAARELTLAFASPALGHEQLAGATVSELAVLSPNDVAQLVKGVVGVPPGPGLAAFLVESAGGLPAATLEWVAWLMERGSLNVGATAELVDDVPALDGAALPAARLALLPPEVARALEAATCQGETFDAAGVMTAFPRATQAVVAQAATRFMPVAGRRWAFQRHGDAAAVCLAPSAERPAMHQRLALAQVELGRTNAAAVDPLEVGQHFLQAGDPTSAVALLQHAAEAAVAKHAPRQAAIALKGLAAALALGGGNAGPRRLECLARAAALCLSAQDAASARAELDEALALATQLTVDSAELRLVQARVLRSEARRARSAEALSRAQAAATPELAALVAVERAEALEQEGDLVAAMLALETALAGAESSRQLARWHGEVDLVARLEARLAALCLQQKDLAKARRLFESSAQRWRASQYPAGEARALSNLGASCALAKDLPAAVVWFTAAAEAGARSGDFLFQARALLQLAKAQKKLEPGGTTARATATEVRRLAVSLGWEQGRLEATALIE